MLDNPGNTYSFFVEPLPGRITARRGEHLVAASDRAKVMYETRLPPVIYFPIEDTHFLSSEENNHRTFCPFKGTAHYHDVTLPATTIQNGAWSYPRALREAQPIEGYIAFDSTQFELSGLPEWVTDRPPEQTISNGFVVWLLRAAGKIADPAELTRQIGKTLVANGIPAWRLNVLCWSLHPQYAGVSYLWERDGDRIEASEARHEILNDPRYTDSPLRHVSDGLGGVRQSLTQKNAEFSFPIIDELRELGGTDYVAMPLRFSDGRINVLTLATDAPGGFTTAHLGVVYECLYVIARYFEVHLLRSNARTLLSTYLGKKTGTRVLGGEIKRGDGEEVAAAVLMCDLRGSTRLSEILPARDYLALLNRYFEAVTEAFESYEGEVLKFVGDAVFAIFPCDDSEMLACQRAFEAALEATGRVAEIPSGLGDEHLVSAIGGAFGRVTYGNVGSSDRLDFTVIGNAANIAARLSDLCKTVGEPILFSSEIAFHNSGSMQSRGDQALRNVARPVEIFVPSTGTVRSGSAA
jgi:adenylate cyclase